MNLDAPQVSTVEQIGAILFYSLEEVTALRTMFIYSHDKRISSHPFAHESSGFFSDNFPFQTRQTFSRKTPQKL